MSIVKELANQRDIQIAQSFIDLVMLQGGARDLRKRARETENALSYAKLKSKESQVKHIKRELKGIYKGLSEQNKKIRLKVIDHMRLEGYGKFASKFFFAIQRTIDLNEKQTGHINGHLLNNYNDRRPFPYKMRVDCENNYFLRIDQNCY